MAHFLRSDSLLRICHHLNLSQTNRVLLKLWAQHKTAPNDKGTKLKRNNISSYSRVCMSLCANVSVCQRVALIKVYIRSTIFQLSACLFWTVAAIQPTKSSICFRAREKWNRKRARQQIISNFGEIKRWTTHSTMMPHKPWDNLRFYSKQSFFWHRLCLCACRAMRSAHLMIMCITEKFPSKFVTLHLMRWNLSLLYKAESFVRFPALCPSLASFEILNLGYELFVDATMKIWYHELCNLFICNG